MRYKLVPTMPDVRFSAIGFGCWSLGGGSGWHDSSDAQSIATVREALARGITFFDTAPVYGFGSSETLLGEALRGRRDDVVLATKCGLLWDDRKTLRRSLAANDILMEVDASLGRLGVDHVDLLQLHWPDHATPLAETAGALEKVLAAGKARYVGVSNFSLADTQALSAMVPVASFQGLYNIFERNAESYHRLELEYRTEREILPYCAEKGLAFIPYSPLFQGVLTGSLTAATRFAADDVRSENPKLQGSFFARSIAATDGLKAIADEAGLTLVELALGWLATNPVVSTVVCGAQHPGQIAANAAAGEVVLGRDVLDAIDRVLLANDLPAS